MGGENRTKTKNREKDDDDFNELSRYESNHHRQTEQEKHMVDLRTIAISGIQRLIENTKSDDFQLLPIYAIESQLKVSDQY